MAFGDWKVFIKTESVYLYDPWCISGFHCAAKHPGGWVIGLYEVYPIVCFVEAGKMWHLSGSSFGGRAAIDSCQLLDDLIRDVTLTKGTRDVATLRPWGVWFFFTLDNIYCTFDFLGFFVTPKEVIPLLKFCKLDATFLSVFTSWPSTTVRVVLAFST